MSDDFELIARHIVAVKDLGAADRLFGGVMLAWLDEAGAAFAKTKAGVANLVTRHIEAMDFLAPGREGDVLAIFGRVARLGTTSVSVEMKVLAEDPATRVLVGVGAATRWEVRPWRDLGIFLSVGVDVLLTTFNYVIRTEDAQSQSLLTPHRMRGLAAAGVRYGLAQKGRAARARRRPSPD